ncbi:MAG TPA: hypothetical protein VME66_05360 [Candidatus Acidoferrales bacterium]|nr:hypothetical protein [Candidatus Acidoferrales bacterium]
MMRTQALIPTLVAAVVLGIIAPAMAQMHAMNSQRSLMNRSMYPGMRTGPDHGMPVGTAGGDGVAYLGPPDLQAAISLVTAGGPPGDFSILKAVQSMIGPAAARAEVAKLNRIYGPTRVTAFITVQNFSVDDAVKLTTAQGVKFPRPMLRGAALGRHLIKLGLYDDTFYEGTQLDHLLSHNDHERVMSDIDRQYGTLADANYHLINDRANYDLAHALGMTSVKLAAYH